ncbi:MAG: UDP-3-O-(3-hydroxymyristoyl)glucosamine N-acyltransferase [Paludibacteraceae bacterium]|nr:UDP-3-O-(3-hydroxymyristoyl)glucosamine N-acyltransferase [Paludibacteraceae bacterium]
MEFTAKQIAEFLGGKVEGNESVAVSDFAKIEEGRPGALSFLSNPKYTHYIYETLSSIVLVNNDFVAEKPVNTTLIRVPDAYAALAQLLQLAQSLQPKRTGIDPHAYVAEGATVEEGAYIGAFAVVEQGAHIGKNARIYPHAFVGEGAIVGEDTIVYAHATLYDHTILGARCIVHAGAVLGADGFGFAPDAEGCYHKIPQIGCVKVDDDVEIGANTTIDRATMGITHIGKGVKLDNLVQIAHNVSVGEHTAMASQTGVAGSTKIAPHCIFAGQVGVAGHIEVAERSIFGAQTGVAGSVKEAGKTWQGSPAIPVATFRRSAIAQKQSPELLRQFQQLQKEVAELRKLLTEKQ